MEKYGLLLENDYISAKIWCSMNIKIWITFRERLKNMDNLINTLILVTEEVKDYQVKTTKKYIKRLQILTR